MTGITNNLLYSWGLNSNGQLGLNDLVHRSSPVQISLSSWSVVTAGNQTTYGTLSDLTLYGWGFNTSGSVGDTTLINRSSPVQVGTSSWTTVSSGVSHMMGITTDGSLYGWGLNTAGAIGDGTTVAKSNPTIVYVPAVVTQSWSQVQAGNSRSVGLLSGRLYTWGSNTSGALGYTGADWRFVGLGAALDNNGKLYTWGD
jgi:alpha-tubulin suppressor-like RCC1 family protein